MQKFLSQQGAKFQEQIERSITTKLYFRKCFSDYFTDTQGFYKLSNHDQELIRKELDDLSGELAYFCLEYTQNLAYKTENYLFTETEIKEAP